MITASSRPLSHTILPGILAGTVGGLVYNLAMRHVSTTGEAAALGQAGSTAMAFTGLLVGAALAGILFALLASSQGARPGELLFLGLGYAVVLWVLIPLTLVPVLRGDRPAWYLGSAQRAFPVLIGYFSYGAAVALTLSLIRQKATFRPTARGLGAIVRGLLGGYVAALFLGRLLDSQRTWLELAGMLNFVTDRVSGPVTMAVGLIAGIVYALLHSGDAGHGAGPTLIRGMLYGFFWWIAGALTLMPLLAGGEPAWSLGAARLRFPALPGFVFMGALIAVVDGWLSSLGRLLFSDDVRLRNPEGIGAQGLRAIGHGAFAGLIGGLVFTGVMVRIGVLPAVARLVGAESGLSGLIVHLVIANIIGASFGLLFLRRSYDLGSAMGWGLGYGFFWWLLGPLTLMPLLLDARPVWTVQVAGMLIPSLIGHLAYGAAVGITFYLLESRVSPWWISHTEMEAERTARRRAALLTSAPALWALAVIIALTIPVVVSCTTDQDLSGYSMSPRGPSYGSGAVYEPAIPTYDDPAIQGQREGCEEP